jgi:predicted acyltransferase
MQSDTANRSLALDALRGIAILLMVFSSRIPFGVLPEWMYHAQVPPPAHVFNPAIPGITWVDLVFPFFLFSMGAAIPLALKARLDRGEPLSSICLSIFKRGALLVFFAIYVKHIQPHVMSAQPGVTEWVLALAGFALLFPMLATLPATWSATTKRSLRLLGWVGAFAVLVAFRAKDGSGFNVTRSDIIILVLANVAVSGSLIWLATRDKLDWRIGLLAFLFALRLCQSLPGWGQWLWNLSPTPWIGTVYFQQYLFIIIPGTIAGDLLLRWRTQPEPSVTSKQWGVAAIGVGMIVVLLVGMQMRWVVPITIIALAFAALGWWLLGGRFMGWRASVQSETDSSKVLRQLFGWGIFWLALGLAFAPYEGGIKKDRATMSYYFVTSGLAFMSLVSLMVTIDLGRIRRGFGLLIATGQNPLVAYAGVQSLVPPVLGTTGIAGVIEKFTPTPWLGAARGAFYTWLVAAVGAFLAQRGILLKT